MQPRPMPPAGALLMMLAAVIALAVHLAAAPHAHPGGQIPGLTYEAAPVVPHRPIALVVTSVQDGSAAARADIAAGDVIDRIDGRPISSVSAVGRTVRVDAAKGVLLHIRHAGESRYKHLPSAPREGTACRTRYSSSRMIRSPPISSSRG